MPRRMKISRSRFLFQSTPESEAPAGEESKEVETTPEAVQEETTEKQEETTETDTVSTEQPQTVSETGQAAQPAEQPDKADKTEHSVSTPQPDIPQESETPAPPEAEETPSNLRHRNRRKKNLLSRSLTLTTGFPLQKATLRAWDFC